MEKLSHLKYILFAIVFCSCSTGPASAPPAAQAKPEKQETAETNTVQPKLNNPVLMNGSSFANYFQALYKLGRYEDLLRFTSKEVLNKFGKEKVLNSYKQMDFAYMLQLKSKTDNPDGSVTLNYLSHQFATPKMVRLTVKIENDSVKLLDSDFISIR